MSVHRRTFLLTVAAASGAGALSLPARAQGAAMADEKDAQAASLGYVSDAKRADAKRFPRYAAGQHCASCALYQGKAGDAAGPCPLFAGRQVAAAGWCSAWAKKA